MQDGRTRTWILFFMYTTTCLCHLSVECTISQPKTFWKCCLVPSLPSSNGRDTDSRISSSAIFYSIKQFSSSSTLQNDAASSPLFMRGVHTGILHRSQHSHAYTLDNRTTGQNQKKALPSASARWMVICWKQADLHFSLGWTKWQGRSEPYLILD
jgi:hypothetical protein